MLETGNLSLFFSFLAAAAVGSTHSFSSF